MKKNGLLLFVAVLLFTGCQNSVGTTSNSQDDYIVYNEANYDLYTTFEIFTVAQLKQIADLSNNVNNLHNFSGKTVILMNDIDFGGGTVHNFDGISVTIGDVTNPTFKGAFEGIFDGNNKTVSGFIITYTDARPTGFIGNTNPAFILKNLTIKNGSVSNTADFQSNVSHNTGGFVGQNRGIIENCINESVSVSSKAPAGGIAGTNTNTIKNCTNNANISSLSSIETNGFVGGIAGSNSAVATRATDIGLIQYSKNTGTINGYHHVGGITGWNYHKSTDEMATKNNAIIEFCYNTGSVSGTTNIGGIVGNIHEINTNAQNGGTVSNCYNIGNISATGEFSGGIAGKITLIGSITNSYNVGIVSGNKNGAIAGTIPAKGVVNNSYYSNTDVSAINYNNGGTDNSARLDISGFGTQNNFTDWDFTSVWKMGNGLSGSVTNRPVLRNNEEN